MHKILLLSIILTLGSCIGNRVSYQLPERGRLSAPPPTNVDRILQNHCSELDAKLEHLYTVIDDLIKPPSPVETTIPIPNRCPIFVMPSITNAPAFPKLNINDNNDPNEILNIVDILTSHIEAIKTHHKEQQNIINKAYRLYLNSCRS